jgi:hypothetical protein
MAIFCFCKVFDAGKTVLVLVNMGRAKEENQFPGGNTAGLPA